MSTFSEEYRQKLVSPERAAQIVKTGDLVGYGEEAIFPAAFDKALAKRADDPNLKDVIIEVVFSVKYPEVTKADPEGKVFTYFSFQFSPIDRMLGEKGRACFVPMQYYDAYKLRGEPVQPFIKRNVLCISTTPMDAHGNFNFGIACSDTYAQLKNADTVIVEVNPRLPFILGGEGEYVNIRDVDYIIESDEPILVLPPAPAATDVEKQIAQNIMPLIPNHACLQLGIGGIPNTIGSLIADSDLKDLGVNSEMFSDSMVDLYEAGKITNKYKARDKGRSTFTFCFGNQRTYDFLHLNPQVAAYHCEYTNNPKYIAMEDNVVSINAIIEIDLLSQVNSESMGLKQISGTGGALDFSLGAFQSKGGKAIIAFESTYQDKEGKPYSRIKPFLTPGGIVTVPRTCVHYVVTEYGVVNMKGRSIWGRAESLINLAHPMFREELFKNAAEMGIWTRTNRIPY